MRLNYLLQALLLIAMMPFISCKKVADNTYFSGKDSNSIKDNVITSTSVDNIYFSGKDNNGHGYVDLDLPSRTLWATCNIGATKPEEYGDYFAWGETEPKELYNWNTYKYAHGGDMDSITKYNLSGECGIIDNLSTLFPEDDAATANWGAEWFTPTTKEQSELFEECYWVWSEGYNGSDVKGHIVYKVKNEKDKGKMSVPCELGDNYESEEYYSLADAHVFFPATGYRLCSSDEGVGSLGCYMSSSVRGKYGCHACLLSFTACERTFYEYMERCHGFPVRAVRTKK